MDAKKETGFDYDQIKLAHKMLEDGATITDESHDNSFIIIIQGDQFRMRLSNHLPKDAFDALHYGGTSWGLSVENKDGARVMYSSSIPSIVANSIGRMIDEIKMSEQKASSKDAWKELEAYMK